MYPSEQKAKELGVPRVNVLEKCREFFYSKFSQPEIRAEFDKIYAFYNRILDQQVFLQVELALIYRMVKQDQFQIDYVGYVVCNQVQQFFCRVDRVLPLSTQARRSWLQRHCARTSI